MNPRTWNLWHGCRKYSEGCENCYMFFMDGVRGVQTDPEKVYRTKNTNMPLEKDRSGRYKTPPGFMLTINMTSDTFIEEADKWRDEMWSIIRKRPDVIFLILTKRATRMRDNLPSDWGDGYDNVILSITCENQRTFDERWPIFRDTPAKHKQMNLAPLIGPIDLTPALSSGQIEQVSLSGECFGGMRPCHHDWLVQMSEDCERYKVNFIINLTGNVYVKDGKEIVTKSMYEQCLDAYRIGLSRFFGNPHYILRSPLDGHELSDKEIMQPVYNKDRCFQCTSMPVCTGCFNCGQCKDVVLVDAEGNPTELKLYPPEKKKTASLDDFF